VFIILISITGLSAQKDYGVHDPSTIVKEKDRYYTFYTSNGVEYAYSTDLCTWRRIGSIFPSSFPSWIKTYVSGFTGNFWAPDVFYMNNSWHVYYSCSTFGSRQSAIGLATTTSLSNPKWEDKGMVVSTNNSSNHNAIDPGIMRHDGKVWLVYGSFWSGIVITEIDSTTGKPIKNSDLHYVANNDPEAASAIHHGDYYYLFFNRGKCCDGVKSTYYINVGRSTSPTGPYLDKSGKQTNSGGGTTILKTQSRFIGPGHFGFLSENGKEYISYHYYDANQNGASKLKISTLSWEDGWPVVNTDFDPCAPVTTVNSKKVKNQLDFNITYTDGKLSFLSEKKGSINIQLFTLSGKMVGPVFSIKTKAGINQLKWNTHISGRSLYLLILEENGTGEKYEKLIDILQ
jgi:arabinan endo-1,5-alpha-L-arabinosidase